MMTRFTMSPDSQTPDGSVVDNLLLDAPADLPPEPPEDGRSTAVWRQWLYSMAKDPEAALAAAIAYREMDTSGRERWLSSLALDAPEVDVPAIALYAPLLAVEEDAERRERLMLALGEEQELARPIAGKLALVGNGPQSTRVFVLASPLYLDFVQVLACGVRDGRFVWVRHDPIASRSGVPVTGDVLEGARLESAPAKSVLDDLAVAVLSHQRTGEPLPDALSVLGDLLGPLGP
jgi:hypothetical protein